MWEKGKMLVACMFAMAWWGIFYPELCFAEGTCETVQTAEAQNGEEDAFSGILRAGDDEIVISSRLLEWCEEKLFDSKE